MSRPTGHGISQYQEEGPAATLLKGFAPFAPPKPNAKPTTPRRGASSPEVGGKRIPPWSPPGSPLEPRRRPQPSQRECAESPTAGPLQEEGLRRMHSSATPGGGGCSADSDQRQSLADAQAHAKAIYRATNPKDALVRGAALSIGVTPEESSECDALVEELLQGGYLGAYPPSRPLAPTGSVPSHRPGHRRSRGELDSPGPLREAPPGSRTGRQHISRPRGAYYVL